MDVPSHVLNDTAHRALVARQQTEPISQGKVSFLSFQAATIAA